MLVRYGSLMLKSDGDDWWSLLYIQQCFGLYQDQLVVRFVEFLKLSCDKSLSRDIKINWLQPPYSAAGCSQLT